MVVGNFIGQSAVQVFGVALAPVFLGKFANRRSEKPQSRERFRPGSIFIPIGIERSATEVTDRLHTIFGKFAHQIVGRGRYGE